ncbi:hypothetical protein J4470_01285 [Candidatus Woesearchaeota archaeon]|nr:hypothetical protein [Candidatus Woesearchaeota archaeon]
MKKKKSKKIVSAIPDNTGFEVTVRRFTEAPVDKKFVLRDGRILKDLKELADAFEHMSDDIFKHHVNPAKNDFSAWASEVLHEKELSEDLEKIDNQLHAQIAVLKHIAKKVFER